ncbi:hypothetical protein M569_00872, partial [Genlisea aurea]
QMETTCGSLLNELQIIWDEVGESDAEKDKMLLELEKECLEVYRRKVDQANRNRAQLRQAIAEAEAELASICASMGERPVHIRQADKGNEPLKAELKAIIPQLEEMRKRKSDRRTQFIKVLENIEIIKNEIYRSGVYAQNNVVVEETDLSLRKFEEMQRELQELEKEKNERLKKVLDRLEFLHSCCLVLGMDFKKTVSEIHPSLGGESEGSKNISDNTIELLASTIQKLRTIKIQRMQQLQDLATSMLELWNLMDTPAEEQQMFQKVTCNIAASEDEITEPNMLSLDFIAYVKAEVFRLEELKVSKMKELVLKKKVELEDLCRKTHLNLEADGSVELALEAVESGAIDASSALAQFEVKIAEVKEDALRRKDILEKVDKWMASCEEESWLEEYNRDDNRYNAGRGAHLTLKRAEKARALVGKLPAMADALASKTAAWENEHGTYFTYDGVRLLSMLDNYKVLRQEKEIELKKQREQKKLQGQLLTEQEALYGSKPSPLKNQCTKKGPRLSGAASNKRLSLGAPVVLQQTPKVCIVPPALVKTTPTMRDAKKIERGNVDNNRDDVLIAAISSSRRGLDLQNARDIESPLKRKPFSPISSMDSSKSNAAASLNNSQDLNRKHDVVIHKTTPFSTPSKLLPSSAADVENRTPQQAPPTPSVPMLAAAITPVCPGKSVEQEIEYSFEEKRAGFVLP